MRKIVVVFGSRSGLIASALMAITLPFHDAIGNDRGLVIGYTSMVLAFLLIYFGIRSYRDNVGGGSVRFGRAFAVGALIALVSSLCYVATWEVIYFSGGAPDVLVKYQASEMAKARAGGMDEQALAKKRAEMDKMAAMYKNPAYNAAMTLMEPLPVGLVVALVSAGLLSRRKKKIVMGETIPSRAS
jgi:hypothetical protein